CQALWREQRAGFYSPRLRFEAIHMMPKPLQPGGGPLWVSGAREPPGVRPPAPLRRGWSPRGPAAPPVAARLRQMKDALAAVGRDPGDLQVTGSLPLVRDGQGVLDVARTVEAVPRLARAGVTDFRVAMRLPAGHSAAADQLSALAGAFGEAASG